MSVRCPQILLSLRKIGIQGVEPPYLRRLRSSRFMWMRNVNHCSKGASCWSAIRIARFALLKSWRKRATRLGATGRRASEREICLWEGLREDLREGGLQRFSEVFSGFQRVFRDILRGFQRFSGIFQRPSQRPSQRQISLSEALRPVAPNHGAPWTFSKRVVKWSSAPRLRSTRAAVFDCFFSISECSENVSEHAMHMEQETMEWRPWARHASKQRSLQTIWQT